MIKFSWDDAKASKNLKKHGITFEEAVTVFYDEFALQFFDAEHSQIEEDRFLLLGVSNKSRVLMVCHCEEQEEVIRIISARKATRNEKKYYKGNIT